MKVFLNTNLLLTISQIKKFNSEQKRKQNEIYIYISRRVRSVIIFESVDGR